ncbi:helix-turn-helix transcriptional regulator [Flavobacterium zepuense]|uniref:Helix-turn-helix transcriptional regulator n=1 Tax=Flavobacterium zepuense TaxID=2593302 RepID=A0A552UTF3_9FLAO|nr:helix-turn-helix transcriptional regulator [Flavobacterium zepuense]TRW21467.1 helix-turn-helix transcriptional regulator [Flavobacterium zepuense]
MPNTLEEIELELSKRIYKLFLKKFGDNKSEFARASNCTEGTIRRILLNKQGITINLLLRIAKALEVEITDLLKGLSLPID